MTSVKTQAAAKPWYEFFDSPKGARARRRVGLEKVLLRWFGVRRI
jgi:hypothetical protein